MMPTPECHRRPVSLLPQPMTLGALAPTRLAQWRDRRVRRSTFAGHHLLAYMMLVEERDSPSVGEPYLAYKPQRRSSSPAPEAVRGRMQVAPCAPAGSQS